MFPPCTADQTGGGRPAIRAPSIAARSWKRGDRGFGALHVSLRIEFPDGRGDLVDAIPRHIDRHQQLTFFDRFLEALEAGIADVHSDPAGEPCTDSHAGKGASEDDSAGNDGARGRQRYGDQSAERADDAAEREAALGRGPEW
jgi:hypothetical protein